MPDSARQPSARRTSARAAALRGRKSPSAIDEIRQFALTLPRAYEAVVHGRLKFRVGQIVFVAFSRDETVMCFAFPKEERDALIETRPDTFLLPRTSDLRFNWVCVRLDRIDADEARELVLDAWLMVVPQRVARDYLRAHRE